MKVIVLAAGKGERLMPLTRDIPKSLLDLGKGKTLLDEQLTRMASSGVIDEVVYVVGYRAAQIESAVATHRWGRLAVHTIYNPFFEMSNNLVSMWLARHEMGDDFLVTNGDCLFSEAVYTSLVHEEGEGVRLVLDRKAGFDEDDMKVRLAGDSVVEVSKLIEPAIADAESPGLASVRGHEARGMFVAHLDGLIRDKANIDRFWLEVFNSLSRAGNRVSGWHMPEGTTWQEVDFHPDLTKLRSLVRLEDL